MASDTPLPLDEPAELTGEWWLPENPDHSAYGRLKYSPDGGLELDAVGGGDVFPHHVPISQALCLREALPGTLAQGGGLATN